VSRTGRLGIERRSHRAPRRGSAALLFAAVAAGIFIGTLDQTVVVTVLPDVIKDIRLPIARFGQSSWIVNGYLLGYTVAMPLVGRLADVFGRVRVFLLSLLIFAIGSVLVAVSPNLPSLVAARAFQAIGGGGLLPVGLAIAADAVSPSRRALALGTLAAANNASTFLGPIWGVAIASVWDWRAIFWLNLPLILPIAVAIPLLTRDRAVGVPRRFDWRGPMLLAAGLTALTFALTDDGTHPRPLPLSLALGLIGAAGIAAFFLTEWRSPQPMIDLRALRQRRVSAAMAIYFLVGGALITALVGVPLMVDVLYGGSTKQGGLTLMRLLLLLPIGGVAGGWLATRIGNRHTVLLGLALAIAGLLWMRAWPFVPGESFARTPPSWQLWGALGAIGLGLGFCDGPLVATVVDAVEARHRATSAALLLVVWTTGMIVGLALLATQGLGTFGRRIGNVPLDAPDFATRFQGTLHRTFDETYAVAAAVLGVAFVIAWALKPGRAEEVIVSPYGALAVEELHEG
jgi:MFS family permease